MCKRAIGLVLFALVVSVGVVPPLHAQSTSPQQTEATPAPQARQTPTAQRRAARPTPRPPQPLCAPADRSRVELVFARLNAWREARGLPPAAWDEEGHLVALSFISDAVKLRSLEEPVLFGDNTGPERSYARQFIPVDISAPKASLESTRIPCPAFIESAEYIAVAGFVCRRKVTFRFEPGLDMVTDGGWLIYTRRNNVPSGGCG